MTLFLLACQAIPKLCKRVGIECDLPAEILPPGLSLEDEEGLKLKRRLLLNKLLLEHSLSWWDIFYSSDIGLERDAIAAKYVARGSEVLDVGSGRGYFSFACAKRGAHVASVDIMDGAGRRGWWRDFREAIRALGLSPWVHGIRANAVSLPFQPKAFDVAASVHAIRNLGGVAEIKGMIREMKRVLRPGGTALIAESILDSTREEHEAYLAFYRLRTTLGWEIPLPSVQDLAAWLEEAGFDHVKVERCDFALQYGPVAFPLRAVSGDRMTADVRQEYERIYRLWEKYGEAHPPVAIVSAKA